MAIRVMSRFAHTCRFPATVSKITSKSNYIIVWQESNQSILFAGRYPSEVVVCPTQDRHQHHGTDSHPPVDASRPQSRHRVSAWGPPRSWQTAPSRTCTACHPDATVPTSLMSLLVVEVAAAAFWTTCIASVSTGCRVALPQ